MARIGRPRVGRKTRPRRKIVGGRLRMVKMRRQVHNFKRTAYLGTQTASISAAGVPSPIALTHTFMLNMLPGVSDFTNLFDQYKINGAKISYVPTLSEGILNPITNQVAVLGYSRLHSAIDYDDSSTPTSEDQLLEYGSHKATNPFQTHTRYLKPKVLQEIYRSSLATSYAPRGSMFIDLATTDVPHYGLKVWCSAPNSPAATANSISYKVYVTLYFTCKNVR